MGTLAVGDKVERLAALFARIKDCSHPVIAGQDTL